MRTKLGGVKLSPGAMAAGVDGPDVVGKANCSGIVSDMTASMLGFGKSSET